WCSWIRGILNSNMASILVNGSPTKEFQVHRGLKQRDPLAPYLFIIIMESLHLSFSRVIEAGIFTGIKIDSSMTLSHLFYTDDAIFIGEWSRGNLTGIMHNLRCFSLLFGVSINMRKSQLFGVGIPDSQVLKAATLIGCSVLHMPFKYLGIMLKTFSIGGRLTLLKSVLESTPIYNMSLFKVPKAVLKSMESIRRNIFNGIRDGEKKIAWVSWSKVIHALHGSNTSTLFASYSSLWSSIIKECNTLKSQGLDLISHCKIRVGNGMSTSFWHDQWLGDSCLRLSYPRLFALENNKVCTVAAKISAPFVSSLRRDVRAGEESAQLSWISDLLDTVGLSNMGDRRFWDLNGDGCFRVKDVRRMLDDMLLPKSDVSSRWIKQIPIKVNVLVWKISMDRLPTRVNLHQRGV
nr:hypothetical protein [Tanacetum cinerariifolium]